jgi:hypothetical protein
MKLGEHAATLTVGSPGVLHGAKSYVLQDADGQTAPVHSVSAGLDYPGVGPEHSYWKETGRAEAFGHVHIEKDGLRIVGHEIVYDAATRQFVHRKPYTGGRCVSVIGEQLASYSQLRFA